VPRLSVKDGEALALIGPSGSGKTTLLHLIAGIAVPQSGDVVTGGVEVSALADPARRDFRIRNVGLVFQEFELLEYLNVRDNVLLPYRIHPALRLDSEVRERAEHLADEVDIGALLDRYVTRLSQGERQRVAICRALVTEPTILLADEPTGNLDRESKERVLDILFACARRTGATLVAVTHDHDVLPRFDRVVDFKSFHVGGTVV
jgi:putative ABC transport system ATP-binding protein